MSMNKEPEQQEVYEQEVEIHCFISPVPFETIWCAFGSDEYKGDVLVGVHKTKEGAIRSVLECHPNSPQFGVIRERRLED